MNDNDPLVLWVDDEPGLLRVVKSFLESEGFQVVTATSGEEALQRAAMETPALVLMDRQLPGLSGVEVMQRLKQESNIPVILVTGTARTRSERVAALDLGADDYIVKPFSLEEVAARIRAVLRRNPVSAPRGIVQAGDLEIDLDRRLVRRAGVLVSLSRHEWRLLDRLAINPSKTISNRALFAAMRGVDELEDVNYLRTWIYRLRQKIEADPASPTKIRLIPGVGYMFDGAFKDHGVSL